MATLNKEVLATLTTEFNSARVFTIGNLESASIKDADTHALELAKMCVGFYSVTPSKLPSEMYKGLASGVLADYAKSNNEIECYLVKEGNWNFATKVKFDKFEGQKHHVTSNWLADNSFKDLKGGKVLASDGSAIFSDDGKILAILLQARKDLVVGQVNMVIARLQARAKKLLSPQDVDSDKPSKFELDKLLQKIIDKADKFDDENPVLLKKLFDDVMTKYNMLDRDSLV